MTVTAVERKRYITKKIQETGAVRVTELSEQLNVTAVTIRSDLEELERRGIAVRTHGGAVLPEHETFPRYLYNTMHENADRKRVIGKCALDLVTADSTVIIDGGSTTAIFAQLLHGYALTVVTNSVPVIGELVGDEHIDLIVSGGAIRKPVQAMVGELARLAYQSIRADIVFLGASGFSLSHGVTTPNLLEADGKRAMIDAAATVCLLADSTKRDKIKFARICGWERIDYFFTDEAPDDFVAALAERGVTVITPDRGASGPGREKPAATR